MAPGTEVKPPRISTGRAFSAVKVSAYCTPPRAPHNRPATSATKPATIHTKAQMCCNGMPIDSAAWWSSATARSARPMRVCWKKSASAVTKSAAMPAAARSNLLITMLAASRIASIGSSTRPSSSARGWLPQTSGARPSMKNASPIVAMNSEIGA